MRESNPHERLVRPPSCLWTNRPWSRRRESNPHFEAYETSKVAVPSLRNSTTSPSWRGQRDSNPYSRADNAASFPSTMSPSGWSQRWESNPHASAGAGLSGLDRLRKPIPPRWDWSARGDSNPDLHGLNVLRLPIAPRADGDHGRTRTATVQALDLLPLPNWATWPLVPLGGLEPPPRGLRARHAPLTLQREWS